MVLVGGGWTPLSPPTAFFLFTEEKKTREISIIYTTQSRSSIFYHMGLVMFNASILISGGVWIEIRGVTFTHLSS